MEPKLVLSSSPHIRSGLTTQRIMLDVLIALIPAFGVSIYVFGWSAILITVICIATCVLTEYVIEVILKRKITISDLSACVTGVLIAFNLPYSAPWWMCIIGSVFAIAIVKQLFGGLGHNFLNPALAGRAFLLASWPTRMTGSAFVPPDAVFNTTVDVASAATPVDATAMATPLGIVHGNLNIALPSLWEMFVGFPGKYGAIGEISALALIIGGLYLIIRGVISWRIPVCYLATVAIIAFFYGDNVIFQLCAGGLMLGAFFMATDYVSSPSTPLGQVIFAVGCGVITMIIRKYGGYPEGVSYSILLMNCCAPLIQKYTKNLKYSSREKKGKEALQ